MRTRTMLPILGFYALMLGVVAVSAGADWPQMGGPDRNNISPETGLARDWPSGGPRELWRVSLDDGFGSPSVRDGKVYILDRDGNDGDNLRCFDLDTGEELWNYYNPAPGRVSHDGSRTAPTVTEDRVYFVGVMGHFVCLDLETRQPLWSRHIRGDFGEDTPRWGVPQAPSLYKDLVIVAPQAPDAFVVAYNKDTGNLVWQSATLGRLGYSMPVIHTLCGVDQVVMAHRDGVAGLSIDDGAVLWTYDGWQCQIPIPYPTLLPDDRLFITGGYRAGSAMIQLRRNNDTFIVNELFTTNECGSQIQQPLFYKGHLYVNSNSNEREDGLMCLTLDGEIKWKTRDSRLRWFSSPTFERGPLLLADGLIYNLDGRRGSLYLIEPSPDEYRQLAEADVLGGRQIWAPMALSQGRLLVRSQREMKCLDIRNP